MSPELVKQSLWQKGLLKWKLWKQQILIYEQLRGLDKSVQEAVVLCARQYGKSFLGTTLATEDCIRNPGSSVLIVGPTIKQTVDIVNQSLRNLQGDAPDGLIRRSKSESRWYIGDSELLIGGFDINNATRIRGRTLSNIYIEELVDSNPDTYLDSMRSDLAPALTHSKNGKMIYLTTLPKFPDHPFILDTMAQAQMNNAFYSYTIDDNEELSEDQYEACVRRCGGRDSIEFKREYLNQIVRDKNIIVVPSYEEKKHVISNIVPSKDTYWQITIDFGGTRDKTVALLHTYIFDLNKFLFWDEFVWDSNTSTPKIVEDLSIWIDEYQIHMIHADAPGQILVDLTVHFGISAMLPPKVDWQANVNNLEAAAARDEIWVKDSLTFLRQSLRSGTFNKNKTDFERTHALGHCDALAAMMYALRCQTKESPYYINQTDPGLIYSRPISLLERQKEETGGKSTVKRFGKYATKY